MARKTKTPPGDIERLQTRFQATLKDKSLTRRDLEIEFHNFITNKGERSISKKQIKLGEKIIDSIGIAQEDRTFLPRDTLSTERVARLRDIRIIRGRAALRDPHTFRFRTRGVETIRAKKSVAGWSRAAAIRDPKTGRFKRWVLIR